MSEPTAPTPTDSAARLAQAERVRALIEQGASPAEAVMMEALDRALDRILP